MRAIMAHKIMASWLAGLPSWNAAYKDEPCEGAPAVEVSIWVPKAVVRAGISEIGSYLKTGLGWKVHRNGGWSGGGLMLGPDELTIVTVKVRAREIRTALRQEEDQLS
jgi:hypothetical protein